MIDVATETRHGGKPGRPRRWGSEAERQQHITARRRWRDEQLAAFRHALCEALARGRRASLLAHGPEEPAAWLQWATERLTSVRLCSYPYDEKQRKPRRRVRPLSPKALQILTSISYGATVRSYRSRVYVEGRPVLRQVWDSLVHKALVQQIGKTWTLTELGMARLEKQREKERREG